MPLTFASRELIRAQQLQSLRRLVRELLTANRFYGPKLKEAGVTAEVAGIKAFTRAMPLTTKAMIVEDQHTRPPYGTNLTYPLHQYVRYHQTSGTTGSPLRWVDTAESWQWMVDNWREVLEAADVHAADRIMFAFSFGPFLGFWTAFEAAAQLGCICLPGGGLSSSARLEMLLANKATVLCCTPTYAVRLAEVAAAEGVDLAARSKVRVIIVAGEPGGSVPATRQLISDRWGGARVFDHHGMTEVGPVTFECPARPGVLHVIEASYLAEVIDPATLDPVRSGETGELVLTTLGRIGSPLLRYRTGDLVQAEESGEPCACGRSDMALLGGILGRADDMVLVRGVNVYPSAVDQIIRAEAGIAEYRVEVTTGGGLTEMSITIEPLAECAADVELGPRLATQLRKSLSLRIPVQCVAPGTLPRFEMKAKRWIKG